MPLNLARNLTSTRVNSDGAALTREAVRRACAAVGLTGKQAAGEQDIDPGLWSRQLSGHTGDHLWLDTLPRLGDDFMRELVVRLADAYGLVVLQPTEEERAIDDLDRALRRVQRLRMAHASLPAGVLEDRRRA